MNLAHPLRSGLCAAGIAAALACGLAAPERASAQAVTNSSLYYRLGGHAPWGGTLNRSQLALRLGMTFRVNYSCGKFDIGLSWTNLMNNLKQLGQQITEGIQAGIAALPMYILEKAQPGLYQLFTTYSAKAELLTAAALKTCEQMEAEIKRGGNPYMDFVEAAKNLQWTAAIKQGNKDIISVKDSIQNDEAGQKAGITWVYGVPAGGVGQKPIKPINDLIVAGYQITCNITNPSEANATQTNLCPSASRIQQAFGTPQSMADWSVKVLGDQEIYTCSQSDNALPSAGTTATGLNARLQDEIDAVTKVMEQVYADPANTSLLDQISTPGFALTPQLMQSIVRMPLDEQPLVLGRMVSEVAMHRTVEKALLVRNVLLTGLSIPQVAEGGPTQQIVQDKLERLTRYIDDLLYESRIRRELTGQTATTIMRESQYEDSLGAMQRQGGPDGHAPLMGGAVQGSGQ